MRFLTSYYRREEDSRCALTLQQVLRVRGKMPIVLGCVCGEGVSSEGAAFCMRLTDWFHESALVGCNRRREPDLAPLMEEAASLAAGNFSVAGMFCVGRRFFLFYRGEQRICLMNRRFLRPNSKVLSRRTDSSGKILMEEGVMQEDVGILIGTERFFDGISEEEFMKCLAVEAVRDQKQAERRLKELGRYNESGNAPADGRAAVFIAVK